MGDRVELNSEANNGKQQVQLTPIHAIERPLSPSPYCAQAPGAEELQVWNGTGGRPCPVIVQYCGRFWLSQQRPCRAYPCQPLPKVTVGAAAVQCSAVQLQFWFPGPCTSLELFRHYPKYRAGPNFDDAAERTRTHPTPDTPSLTLLPPSSPHPYDARSIAPGEGSPASRQGTALLGLPAVSRDPAQRIARNRVPSPGRRCLRRSGRGKRPSRYW